MNKPIRLFLCVCAMLLWTTQHLPAPIEVPSETPSSDSTPRKKPRKVSRTYRKKGKTVERAEAVSPDGTPAAGVPPAAAGAPSSAAPGQASGTPPPVNPPAPAPPAGVAAPPENPAMVRRTAVKPSANSEIVYTITATQPFDSKLTGQKIRLSIQETGERDVTLDNGKVAQQQVNSTRNTSVNTGRSRNLVQLRTQMKEIFQRFLSSATTPNQDLGKVGDAHYGGELHFVAETADTLRFDYVPATASVLRFKRADIAKFAELLAQ